MLLPGPPFLQILILSWDLQINSFQALLKVSLHFPWPERSTSNSSVPLLLSAPALGGKDYHQQTALLGLACGDSWENQPFLRQAFLSEEGVWAQTVYILFLCW